MKIFTGIGARKTPGEIRMVMGRIAKKLANDGWILRTGDAVGADAAFRNCAGNRKQVFTVRDVCPAAMKIAAKYHGAWDLCSDFAKKLHGRSVFQVLGKDLDTPSSFVVCWTPDGATSHKDRTIKTGGTGTAISVASENGVLVFNLARPEHLERVMAYLGA